MTPWRRRPVALLVWAVLVAIVGGLTAASRSDGSKVATAARNGTTSTTVTTAPGGVAPGDQANVSAASPATADRAAAPAPAASAPGSDEPAVDSGSGGGQPAARVQPTPGTYHVKLNGTSSLNGQPQQVPPEGTYTIEQLNDTDQHQTGDFDLVMRWAPDSASIVSMKIAAANKEFVPPQPVLFVPFPGTDGTRWEWSMTSTDGKTTVHQSSQITGQDSVDVGGVAVPVFVVESDITFQGDLTGTAHLTSWVSPDYRLAAKQHTVVDVTYNLAFTLKSDVTSTLMSLTPS